MPPPTDHDRAEANRRVYARVGGLGLELIGTIAAMMAIGWLLDRWWGSWPWLFVSGAVVGIVGGLIKVVRDAGAVGRRVEQERQAHARRSR